MEAAGVFPEGEAVPELEEDNTADTPPELEEAASALEENNNETVGFPPEEAEAAVEAQPQDMEVLVIKVLVREIMCKKPRLWSPVEQLLVARWAAKQ